MTRQQTSYHHHAVFVDFHFGVSCVEGAGVELDWGSQSGLKRLTQFGGVLS